jgi:PIN domain nuclease of toxin-antitoxin system
VRLLLDTHIWLWAVGDPSRLAPRVLAAISDPDAEIWLSPISVWEALLLAQRGRIQLTMDPLTWVRDRLGRGPYREAAVTWDVAIESRSLPLEHEDPADRFLAATARVYGLTLVTADHRLLRASGFPVLANV